MSSSSRWPLTPICGQYLDRKLVDIFAVESEVAKAIADALQAKLTGGEQQALAVKPTNNSEAYDAYLRGLALGTRAASPNDFEKVVGSYERSVQLDPAFALAWARLSRASAQMYFSGLDATVARRDASERALNAAQKLEPIRPKPCWRRLIINIGCCGITSLPKRRSAACESFCQAAATFLLLSP